MTDETACQAGDTSACVTLGILYDGQATAANDPAQRKDLAERSAKAFQRACDGGNALGCMSIAVAYDRGNGVPRDPAHAKTLLTRAKVARVVEQKKQKAEATQKAQASATGPGRSRTSRRNQAASGKTPTTGATSKAIDGTSLDSPSARPSSFRGTSSSWAPAGTSVEAAGPAYEEPSQRTQTQNERACDRGDARTCYFLSACYTHGEGVKKNPVRAEELARRADRLLDDACKMGDPRSCLNLADRVEETNLERAQKLLARACSLDKTYCH